MDSATGVEIELFTDPACPFGFAHEPVRRRLTWLYGDGLRWRPRMIVLAGSVAEMEARGLTPARLAHVRSTVARRTGMPIASDGRQPLSPTRPAALAVVAARAFGQAASDRLLRQLRVLAMSGRPIGERDTIAAAARSARIDVAALLHRTRGAAGRRELQADMAAARHPSAAALALSHHLSLDPVVRYSAPSCVLHGAGGGSFTVPGLQSGPVYEAAIANLAPGLARRDTPREALEVLRWAGEPLATAEVAAVMEVDHQLARVELARVAHFSPVAADGYWSPRVGVHR